MAKTRKSIALSPEACFQGYWCCVDNAINLLKVSQKALDSPAVALALCQIGQEEVGKSYMLLSAVAGRKTAQHWELFWRRWTHHDSKAYGAFFFEWFNPLHVEVTTPAGKVLDGYPTRSRISSEKTIGFYVDYDPGTGLFTQPRQSVEFSEALNRSGALVTLANTALQMGQIIRAEETAFRLQTISEVICDFQARRTWQQDVAAYLDALALRSGAHGRLVAAMRSKFPSCWAPGEDTDLGQSP
ncbi:MAG: AbiV family abortive infection protein [Gemmatimonadales bacterium]|nr:AbiV family abortive infection protein [Gemmatimonadales bacterium]